MATISQRSLQAASQRAIAQQKSVDVAHRGAQLITFTDDQLCPLSWAQVSYGLVHSPDFCQLWNQTWAELPFDFEWKPVPIHPYTAKTHPFFAVVFPAKFRPADPTDFQPYLKHLAEGALTATFPNFSGDAQLIVPKDTGEYGHIAAFCRTAPERLQRTLWWEVGKRCMAAIANDKPVWCNTHGHGVPWLHVRFDQKLKYSAFPPRGSISATSQAIWYKQVYRQAMSELNYRIRIAGAKDEPVLWKMLMHAAHESSMSTVKENSALARYVSNWGRAGDMGVVAEQDVEGAVEKAEGEAKGKTESQPEQQAIGAAWLRLSKADSADNKGYGYVDDEVPELAIAVTPEARSLGVGTNLLTEIMTLAQKQFPAVSLSVRGDNPAIALYKRVGFEPVNDSDVKNRTGGISFTMIRRFTESD